MDVAPKPRRWPKPPNPTPTVPAFSVSTNNHFGAPKAPTRIAA